MSFTGCAATWTHSRSNCSSWHPLAPGPPPSTRGRQPTGATSMHETYANFVTPCDPKSLYALGANATAHANLGSLSVKSRLTWLARALTGRIKRTFRVHRGRGLKFLHQPGDAMTCATEGRSTQRITSLDGLRGLAALAVVLHHAFLTSPAFWAARQGEDAPYYATALTYSPVHLLWGGHEAVLIFFVLSGLVLTLPFTRASGAPWRRYYVARAIRLYLPVVASVLFASALTLAWPRNGSNPALTPWVRSHDIAVTAILVLKDSFLLGGVSNLNSPLWSLRWEVIFSILLPIYVLLAKKLGTKYWAPLLLLSIAFTATGRFIGYDWAQYLPLFGVGALIAVNIERLRLAGRILYAGRMARWRAPAILSLAALLTIAEWAITKPVSNTLDRLNPIIVVPGVALLVVLAFSSRGFSGFLESPPLRFLGTISFSLYLVHEPILVSIATIIPVGASYLVFILGIPISICAAWLFFRIVESNSHKLARLVQKRRSTSASTPAPATASY